jgi:hypothetical protein
MALTLSVNFREFGVERFVLSLWIQKQKCRAFQELSIDASLADKNIHNLFEIN